MLRVKDGILFLGDWLSNIEKLVDEIVVVDNGSKDGTYEILNTHPKVIDIKITEGFDEGRDKNLLYEMARKRKPDWLLWLDIDEIFEESFKREDLLNLTSNKNVNRYFFRRFHFINEKEFNGTWYWLNYISWPDRVLWREQTSGYFDNIKFNNGLVKGIQGKVVRSNFRIKHFGYINKSLINKKNALYRSIDPNLEKTYKLTEHKSPIKIKWYEIKDSKIRVLFLNCILDLFFIKNYLFSKIKNCLKMFKSY